MKLSDLSKDLIVKIAITFDLPEILNLCRTSRDFNTKVCENKDFWINKYIRDFPNRPIPSDAKEFYKNMIILNNKDITDQLMVWILTNVELESVEVNKKAFKHNGKYTMKVIGDELDLEPFYTDDDEEEIVRLFPENITLDTLVYLPQSICLSKGRGINYDHRGTEDSDLEFRDFHEKWKIEKGYRTIEDIANGLYKIKSHKYENWYEWIQTIDKYEQTPDCINISFYSDHGS